MPWTDEELQTYLSDIRDGDKSSFCFEVQAMPEPWYGTGYKLNGRDLTYSQADQVNAWVDEQRAQFEEKKAK